MIKKFLFLTLYLKLSPTFAEVVVPKDALNPAQGTQKIIDRSFDYTVSDEGGWGTYSSYVESIKELKASASKSYFIEYKLKEGAVIDQKIASRLVHDAFTKCVELSHINFPIIRDIWKNHDLDIIMTPEIVSNFGIFDNQAAFKCLTKFALKE